ncbi:MAG: hypothetical protein IT372_15125 [Polyangiaceae bacterium]|nr:hypothetical protein [Polyangiaceae bacterium]
MVTYPSGGEQSVEVRGNFRPHGWASGVPMVQGASGWTATIEVPWNLEAIALCGARRRQISAAAGIDAPVLEE